jgi:hypothetical protein
MAFHPGPNGEYSVIRWTAPQAGFLSLTTMFSGLVYVGPTTTDVHVLLNGISLFDDVVEGFSATSSFSAARTVAFGDAIDFAVGFGSNRTYFNDSTGACSAHFLVRRGRNRSAHCDGSGNSMRARRDGCALGRATAADPLEALRCRITVPS